MTYQFTDKEIEILMRLAADDMARQLKLIEDGYLDAIRFPIGKYYDLVQYALSEYGNQNKHEVVYQLQEACREFFIYRHGPKTPNKKSKGSK